LSKDDNAKPKPAQAAPRSAQPLPQGASLDSEETVTTFANLINSRWRKQVSSIFETGAELIKAKKAIQHGQWGRLFERTEDRPRPVDFGEETAARLMKIAGNEVLSNPAVWPVLPASWRCLYEICKLAPPLIQELIDDGTINSEIGVADVGAAVNARRLKIFRARMADLAEAMKLLSADERMTAQAELVTALGLPVVFTDGRGVAPVQKAA
jgi:hypothetical protein